MYITQTASAAGVDASLQATPIKDSPPQDTPFKDTPPQATPIEETPPQAQPPEKPFRIIGTEGRSLRQKREIYLTFQDMSQAVCIGMCMYSEKRSYFRCQRRCRIGLQKTMITFKSRERENDVN